MFEMSQSIGKLSAALAKAQGQMGGAIKEATNPHFRSKYATLDNVVEAIKKPLSENGLAYAQFPGGISDNCMEMTTVISHAESGEWMRGTMMIPLGKKDAQGVGSAVSYCRRYSLMAVLGIPAEDDDGNAASEQHKPEPPPKSSAALKREDAWTPIINGLRDDLLDATNKPALDRLREEYRARARAERWPAAWLSALANEFDNADAALLETFPGDR